MIRKSSYFFIFFLIFSVLFEIFLNCFGVYSTQSEKTFGHFVNPFEQQFNGHYNSCFRQNIHCEEFQFMHTYDKYGFRNCDNEYLKSEILVFGDSFTEGMGAHQDSTWSKFLSRQLDTPIYNAGKIGSDPFFYLKEYKRLRKKINAKSVFVLLNYSDIADFRFRHSKDVKCDVNLKVYEKLHLYRFYNHFILGKDYMFLDKGNRSTVLKRILEDITSTIVQLNESCLKDNRKLFVFIHPLPQQYYKNLDSRLDFNYIENLVTLLKLNDIKTFSLRKDMEKIVATEKKWRNISWQIDGHFNAKGYEILAQLIYNKLLTTKDF
jgi:hypothetical protein